MFCDEKTLNDSKCRRFRAKLMKNIEKFLSRMTEHDGRVSAHNDSAAIFFLLFYLKHEVFYVVFEKTDLYFVEFNI